MTTGQRGRRALTDARPVLTMLLSALQGRPGTRGPQAHQRLCLGWWLSHKLLIPGPASPSPAETARGTSPPGWPQGGPRRSCFCPSQPLGLRPPPTVAREGDTGPPSSGPGARAGAAGVGDRGELSAAESRPCLLAGEEQESGERKRVAGAWCWPAVSAAAAAATFLLPHALIKMPQCPPGSGQSRCPR